MIRRLHQTAALALFAAAPITSAPARAADAPETVDRATLRVCADPDNLPYSNQKEEGFENKIASLFAAKLNVPLHYVWYPNTVGFLRNTLKVRRCDLVMGIVTGAEMVDSTIPYYRSTFVLVTRKADDLKLTTLTDPRLHKLHIGLIASTPPSNILVQQGLIDNVLPYQLMVDSRYEKPSKDMIDDLLKHTIDVGILWGPYAGYEAKQHGNDLTVTPIANSDKKVTMDFYIAMGVRPGEVKWKRDVSALIEANRAEINTILKDYGVPMLDAQGAMVQ